MDTIVNESSFSSGFINDLLLSDNSAEYQLVATTGHSCIYKTIYKGKILILKAANPDSKDLATSAALLQREYQILSELDNPFIVRTWGLRKDPQIGECLILDYVDGMPLDEFIKSRPSRKTRQRIVNELLDAVAYLHAKQIVHKDLKPSNILITTNGEHVKLIDFGFSDADSQMVNNLGCTNRYASPEQLNGQTPDFRSDIYTLGMIIREIEPHRNHLTTKRCLKTNPDRRYQDVKSFARAIQQRNRLPFILIAIAVLAITALNAIMFSRSKQSEVPASSAIVMHDTLVVKETTYIHDTITPTDPAAPVIEELHGWYDKAERQAVYNLKHLEYKYSRFALFESSIFYSQMYALKTHYQTLYPKFQKQIEEDYTPEYSLRYQAVNKIVSSYPFHDTNDPDTVAAYQKASDRSDSIRSALRSNPKQVFTTLK